MPALGRSSNAGCGCLIFVIIVGLVGVALYLDSRDTGDEPSRGVTADMMTPHKTFDPAVESRDKFPAKAFLIYEQDAPTRRFRSDIEGALDEDVKRESLATTIEAARTVVFVKASSTTGQGSTTIAILELCFVECNKPSHRQVVVERTTSTNREPQWSQLNGFLRKFVRPE